jgi:hypothetical protein
VSHNAPFYHRIEKYGLLQTHWYVTRGFIPIASRGQVNLRGKTRIPAYLAEMDQNPFWAESVPEVPRVSLVICRGVKMGYIYSPVHSQWYPIILQLILKYQEIITICFLVSLGSYPNLAIF